MADDPFILNFTPEIGVAQSIAPGIRRLVAPNASPMTFRGTNTYLLGEVDVAVIDPGPEDAAHLDAILRAVGDVRKISHIFVTHSHVDHSPLAGRLSAVTGAPVLALGDSQTGRSPVMTHLAATCDLGGGEGVDHAFQPDITLADDEVTRSREWSLRAIATPGHFSNHLCFAVGAGGSDTGEVFSGDHVMSWATTLVSPPDGDLTAFLASLALMQTRRQDQVYLPGHGAVLEDPQAMLRHQIAHRQMRESQILAELSKQPATPIELANRIYTEIPRELIPAASRNVFSHLIDLLEKRQASISQALTHEARFSLAAKTG